MRYTSLVILTLLSALSFAYAQLSQSGMGKVANGGGGGVTNYILLVDGASFILQTDAASKICLAGGC